jgi:hypothetical protein
LANALSVAKQYLLNAENLMALGSANTAGLSWMVPARTACICASTSTLASTSATHSGIAIELKLMLVLPLLDGWSVWEECVDERGGGMAELWCCDVTLVECKLVPNHNFVLFRRIFLFSPCVCVLATVVVLLRLLCSAKDHHAMPPVQNGDTSNTILFSAAKKEVFSLTNGLKLLQRRLKSQYKLATCVDNNPFIFSQKCIFEVVWRTIHQFPYMLYRIKDEITTDKLLGGRIVIFFGPKEKFSAAEVCLVRHLCDLIEPSPYFAL